MTCRSIKIGCTASAVVLILLGATPLVGAPAAGADTGCVTELVCPPIAPDPGPAPAPVRQPEPEPKSKPPQEQPAPTTTTTTPPRQARSANEATATLLTLLNKERAARGLPLMQRRGDVDAIAAGWSKHLAAEGSLSHNREYFSAPTRRRLDARVLGENVARNNSPEAAHAALMASPPHRANILDPRFTVVGLGAVEGHRSWWITQNFVQPRRGPVVAQAMPSKPASNGAHAIRLASAPDDSKVGGTPKKTTVTDGSTPSNSIDLAMTPPSRAPRFESQSAGLLPMPGSGGRAWGAATVATAFALAGWWLALAVRQKRTLLLARR